MAWTDLSAAFAYGSKLTSAQMQNLRDNIAALAAGDSGAPRIKYGNGTTSGGLQYNCGSSREVGDGTANNYFEVLGADGSWYQSCFSRDDSGGGG